MKTSSLLIDDLPLQLLPRLAVKIGLNEAVILQQIHFLLKMAKGGREISGHKWVWNTIEAWRSECFPFFSTRTIERAIKNLEDKKLLLSCQPDGRMSRKKYYRVNYDALERLNREPAKMAESIPTKRRVPHPDKMAASKTETTSDTSGTETSRKEGKCSIASSVCIPSEPDVLKYITDNRIPIQTARSWWNINSKNKWKIKGKFKIHDWRKSLSAYAAVFKPRTHDKLPTSELEQFADDEGVDADVYGNWLDWGNRNGWTRKNPITGEKEPVFDLKASLLAFDQHIQDSKAY